MPYRTATIRSLIDAAFGDEELSTFCFDHFPPVYKQFTTGQTKGARVRMLVEHAQQQGLFDELLDRLKKANPYMYAKFEPQLMTPLPAPGLTTHRLPAIALVLIVLVGGVALLAGFVIHQARDSTPKRTPEMPSPQATSTTPDATIPAPPSSPILRLEQVGEPPFPDDNVRAITLAPSGVLVAMDGAGLRRVNDPALNPDLPEAPVAITEAPDGHLWVGTKGNGLIQLVPDGSTAKVYTHTDDGADITVVGAIAADDENGIWVGAGILASGVYVLNGEHQWRTDSWNAGEEYIVNAIALEQGRIWFATYGGGVRRLAPVTHEWTIYDQARCGGMVDCLLSDDVFAIYIAEDGRKWLGTANGLSVLDDQGNKIVWQSFTQADGLPHSRVVALTGDGKGHIFVGTVEGLGIVNEKLGSARAQFIGGSLNGYISALAFDPDQNKLWVGTLGEGLSVWSISDQ